MVPLERIKALLYGGRTDQVSGETERQTSTTLYECPACETVYISEGMESCPECGDGVEHVPDEREIGLVG
jgi:rubrerythrin